MALSVNEKVSWVTNMILLIDFLVDVYNHDNWFKNEESADEKEESVDLSDMSQLEGDQEVKERKG